MKKIIALILTVCIALYFYNQINPEEEVFAGPTMPVVGKEKMSVHYIDVGQADSILIITPEGKSILVDAGNYDDYNIVNSYLYNQGIGKLDIAIVTHPHEDHMGAMGKIVSKYRPNEIYIAEVPESVMGADEKYVIKNPQKELEEAASSIGVNLTYAYADMIIPVDTQIKLEVISPVKDKAFSIVNDYSITFKMTYEDADFLFTGDIESAAERDILNRYADNIDYLNVDVLKTPHHGAISSSTRSFLVATEPRYSIVSVGENNPFAFPSEDVSKRLLVMGEYFRTDSNGHVIVTTDGYGIDVITQKDGIGYSYK